MTGEVQHRLDALQDNIKWLQRHDLDENREEAVKRLGLIQGDARGLLMQIADDETPLVESRVVKDEDDDKGIWSVFR